jgi:hypothetical protein
MYHSEQGVGDITLICLFKIPKFLLFFIFKQDKYIYFFKEKYKINFTSNWSNKNIKMNIHVI